jgi:hypothetical protein
VSVFPIPQDSGDRRALRAHPHPLFFNFRCKHNHFPNSTLAWRLGGPWATLGPRLGHPVRQRVATPKCKDPADVHRLSDEPRYPIGSQTKTLGSFCGTGTPACDCFLDRRLGPNRARGWLDWVEKPSPCDFSSLRCSCGTAALGCGFD